MSESKNNKKDLSSLKYNLTGKNDDENPVLEISYSEKHLTAYINIKPQNPDVKVFEKDIKEIIDKENICYGIREDLPKCLEKDFNSQNPIKEKKYIIAKGKPPVPTKPESVDLLAVSGELIIEGEVVGEYIPEERGEFGIDVHNKRVAPKLDKNVLSAGDNLKLINDKDKKFYSAYLTGVLNIDEYNHIISILPEEDGKFDYEITDSGELLINIYPPIGRKDPVVFESVYKALEEEKLTSIIITENLQQAINKGRDEKVEKFLIGKGTPTDYEVNITITKDKMKAYMDIVRPVLPLGELTTEKLMRYIRNSGIKKGIIKSNIKEAIENINFSKESQTDILIAKGLGAVDDEEDEINYNINILKRNTEIRITENEKDGEIMRIGDIGQDVNSNELLLTLIKKEKNGHPGYNIFGDKMDYTKAEKTILTAGLNVRSKIEELNHIIFYSVKKGTVYIYDDKVNVI